jgi:tetratricopeptide (TPR) repeat protein
VRLAWLLYHARRYDDAIRELQPVLDAEPDNKSAHWFRGFALIDSSRLDEAVETLERLTQAWDRNPAALGLLARAYGRAGRRESALEIVSELKARQLDGYVPPAPFIHAYVGLGDRENAFAALDRAYRERSNIMQLLKTHPLYDSLRDDPRFTELVHRVGFE